MMLNPMFYRMGGRMASLGTRLIAQKGRIGWLPPPLSAWTHARDFPTFAEKSFTTLWEEGRGRAGGAGDSNDDAAT